MLWAKVVHSYQSSQYHHLSSLLRQGGNGTHDITPQKLHGLVTPSPSRRNVDAIAIPTTLIIIPKYRKTFLFVVFQKPLFSGPKKPVDTRPIVDKPHKNPNIIPPKSIVFVK